MTDGSSPCDVCGKPTRGKYGVCARTEECLAEYRRRQSPPRPPKLPQECAAKGCTEIARKRDWCETHYMRWLKYGDADFTQRIIGDDDARFWSKTDKRGEDECWPWTGSTSFKAAGRTTGPWEFSYIRFVGQIPDGHHVEHDPRTGCTGKPCVNWHHIRAVMLWCRGCGKEFPDPATGRHHARVYCSPECRRDFTQPRKTPGKQPFAKCEVYGCTTLVRSAQARWCELHYSRHRRTGSVLPNPNRRHPKGACYHCDAPSGPKALFCSSVCMRRDRIGMAQRDLRCALCAAQLPEDRRADSLTCSKRCLDRLYRATRTYGLTLRETQDLYRDFTGCGICGVVTEDVHVDHCHGSGKVRALLCGPCNCGLGMFREDPEILRAAIAYIGRHRDGLGDEQPARATPVQLEFTTAPTA